MKYFLFTLFVFAVYTVSAVEIPEFMKNDYEFREYRPEFHEHHNCSHKHHNLQFMDYTKESYINKRNYDALSYDVFLDWSNLLDDNYKGREFQAVNRIKLKIDKDTDEIDFDILYLNIDSIYSDGKKLVFNDEFFFSDDKLSIIDRQFKSGDTIEYTVFYTYNNQNDGGVYIYKSQNNPLVYTQNEPEDARYWLPSNDRPYDKVIASIAIKVPTEYTATSNGFLDSLVEEGNSHTYYYSHPSPITTYLMVANASEYVSFRHWYKRVTNPSDSIPIDYFVWEEDYLPESDTIIPDTRNAHFAFRNVSRMIEIMAELYGEYPFEKYGMTAVEPYFFGGMEHQTMTTVHRNWLYGYAGIGILHEIAHQWLGDLITCATWNDIWINEGGATFSEHIFYEKWTGNPAMYDQMTMSRINSVLDDEAVQEYSLHNLPTNMIFNKGYYLSYYKASIVYHMLRYWLGDDVFIPTLRNMLEHFKFTSVETKDFANYFIENVEESPLNLEKYFEQWVYGVGFPYFEIDGTYVKNDTNYTVNLRINQIQEQFGFYEVYEMPLKLKIDYGFNQIDTIEVYNNLKLQEYTFDMKDVPNSIEVIPLSVLSKTRFTELQDVTSVLEDSEINSYIYPNPLINSNKVNIESKSPVIKITLVNELGEIISQTQNDNIILNDNFNSGLYFIVVETGKGRETHKLMYMK
jgi:aminopeptidase N